MGMHAKTHVLNAGVHGKSGNCNFTEKLTLLLRPVIEESRKEKLRHQNYCCSSPYRSEYASSENYIAV